MRGSALYTLATLMTPCVSESTVVSPVAWNSTVTP
jgi:hypothetical protein